MQSARACTASQALPFPWVTLALVAVNCAVFCLELTHPGGIDAAIEQWGEVPRRIASGGVIPGTALPAWTAMLTYMFLHGRLSHLGGNMLTLALVGASLERHIGASRMALVYFGSGIIASAASVLAQWHSQGSAIGASGAVAGVVVAWALLIPATWRTGWLALPSGWRNAATWGETALRAMLALRALVSWVVWPLAVAICAANWNLLAFRSNLTHIAGALAGGVLILPYAVQVWCQPRLRAAGIRRPLNPRADAVAKQLHLPWPEHCWRR